MDDKPPIPAPLPPSLRKGWVWKALLAAGLVAALVLATFGLPVRAMLLDLLAWEHRQGPWGPVFFVATYVLAYTLLIPGTVLTVGGGFLFKMALGVLCVSVGTTLGAAAAFLIGRTFLQGWVNRKLARHVKLDAIDDALARQGFKVVLLTRLSPAPSFLMNYAFSLTRVKFWPYLAGSWLGMLPRTLVWVYVGSVARSLTEAVDVPPAARTVLIVYSGAAFAMLVVLAAFFRRLARKALETLTRRGRHV